MPLPNAQSLDGFTANGANTVFTVPQTGTYLITYHVNPTVAVAMTSQVLRNGTAIPGSVRSPVATVSYEATVITPLTAGDTLTLQLSGVAAVVVLQGGSGASLTAVRLAWQTGFPVLESLLSFGGFSAFIHCYEMGEDNGHYKPLYDS